MSKLLPYVEPPWGEDKPGWMLWVVVAWCAVVFGGSMIGFVMWALHQ